MKKYASKLILILVLIIVAISFLALTLEQDLLSPLLIISLALLGIIPFITKGEEMYEYL